MCLSKLRNAVFAYCSPTIKRPAFFISIFSSPSPTPPSRFAVCLCFVRAHAGGGMHCCEIGSSAYCNEIPRELVPVSRAMKIGRAATNSSPPFPPYERSSDELRGNSETGNPAASAVGKSFWLKAPFSPEIPK